MSRPALLSASVRPRGEAPRRIRPWFSRAVLALLGTALAFGAAGIGCAKVEDKSGSGGTLGTRTGGVGGTFSASGGHPGVTPTLCPNNLCSDFPEGPLIDPESQKPVPPNAADMFGGNGSGSGPCVTEPEDGALYPNNWLRPRVKWTGAAVAQIKVTASNQTRPLVAYTNGDSWRMPRDLWQTLAVHTVETDIAVEVRLATGGTTRVSFRIAPVGAGGSLVFWSMKADAAPIEGRETIKDLATIQTKLDPESKLSGFTVGDEKTVDVLAISRVQQESRARPSEIEALYPVRCIGCHVGMPDRKFVAFLDVWPWRGVTASVESEANMGMPNPAITPTGTELLRQGGLGTLAFSAAHWQDGDRTVIVPYANETGPKSQSGVSSASTNAKPRLAWMDLASTTPFTFNDDFNKKDPSFTEGVHMGFLARDGDTRGAATPVWSHDGAFIVYASTAGGKDGRLDKGETDLFTVPYANRKGGAAKGIAGAALATYEEYYPALSPDDQLVAFTRVKAGGCMYQNSEAEVAVIPTSGGTAVPLRANQPPACTGAKHPGVNNHWARWAPAVGAAGANTYYWLIFSSSRQGKVGWTNPSVAPGSCFAKDVMISQLYVTAVVVNEIGQITTYPAIYLWNQAEDRINLTPAWEDFVIPPVG